VAVPGSALVTWTSATSSTGVTYTVYYQATNSPLAPVMYTRCGLKATAINAGVQPVTGPTIKGAPMTQVIPGLTQTQTYYFNVIVEDGNGNYWAYTHTSPISLSNNPGPGNNSGIMKYVYGVGIPVLVVLILGVAYLVYKNRELSKELDVEMHDVPKKAIIKATGHAARAAKTTEKYSALLQDGAENDDDDDDDYSPPDFSGAGVGGVSINSRGGAHYGYNENDTAGMLNNQI